MAAVLDYFLTLDDEVCDSCTSDYSVELMRWLQIDYIWKKERHGRFMHFFWSGKFSAG